MSPRRAILEVLKFLSPHDLLQVDLASIEWHCCSRMDEVWAEHLPTSAGKGDSRCIRDICREHLTQPYVFAHFFSRALRLFDLRSEKVKIVMLPEAFVPTSFGAWVSLPRKVLYCGGVRDGYVATSYLVDIHSLAVEKLPDMITNRAGGGLVYVAGKVYIFGGDNENRRGRAYGDLSACEKFTLSTASWTALPDMQRSRRSFTPALLRGLIYIAGGAGSDNRVEVFCVRSERFLQPGALRLQFTDALASAFAVGNSLVVLANTAAWQYDAASGDQVKKVSVSYNYWYSPGASICYQGVSYFGIYFDERVWKLDADLRITLAEFSR